MAVHQSNHTVVFGRLVLWSEVGDKGVVVGLGELLTEAQGDIAEAKPAALFPRLHI